jgi:hypothetical protein
MTDNQSIIEPLIEKVEAFGITGLELIKLKSIDKVAMLTGAFTARLLAILTLSIFLVIASIGLALYLGDNMEKMYYGFFIVAGGYGLLGFVLYFIAHNWIKKNIENTIISQILN